MKAKRLITMRKGVVAAAQVIDQKMRQLFGDPLLVENRFAKQPYARKSPYRVALVTLTYRDDVEWSPEQLSSMLRIYREWFKRRKAPFHFVWTVELQGNGKPHYHVIMWFPQGITPPFPDKAGWWPHGMSNAVFARSPVGYIAKYASKGDGQSGHHLPKGARLWGYGGLGMDERGAIAFAVAPRWLKNLVRYDAFPRRKQITTKVHRTAAGVVIDFKKQITAWVVTAGEALGWAYLSPYRFEGMSPNGLMLSHSGVIEAICPEGDSYFIPHRS